MATLEMEAVSKRFGAVQALTDVDFVADAGEVVALVGDNGAGKSTLIKVVAGVHHADSGTVRFDGETVRITTPDVARHLGIATVYQDLALCENLDVVANLFLGRERTRRGYWLDEANMEHRTRELLRELSVKIPDVRTPARSLSGGQRQSVSIARALLGQPKLVILDEPTAALGVEQSGQVIDLIKRLREQGLAVVVISHNLQDVFAVADRIAVLRLGRMEVVFDAADVTEDRVVTAMTAGVEALRNDGEVRS